MLLVSEFCRSQHLPAMLSFKRKGLLEESVGLEEHIQKFKAQII